MFIKQTWMDSCKTAAKVLNSGEKRMFCFYPPPSLSENASPKRRTKYRAAIATSPKPI